MQKKFSLVIVVMLVLGGFGAMGLFSQSTEGSSVPESDTDPIVRPLKGQEGPVELSSSATATPVSGISFTVDYSITGEIIESECYKGEESTWNVKLTDGEINIYGHASITMIGVDESFDKTQSIPLGTEVEVPIAAGGAIKVPVKVTANAQNIEVTSDIASTTTDSLQFDSEGKEVFPVTVSSNASLGDSIEVDDVEIVPTIEVGLKAEVDYTLGTWTKNIAKYSIGAPSLDPKLSGSAEVTEKSESDSGGSGVGGLFEDQTTMIVLPLIIVVIVIIAVLALVKKRKKKGGQQDQGYRSDSRGPPRYENEPTDRRPPEPEDNPPSTQGDRKTPPPPRDSSSQGSNDRRDERY